MHKQYVLGRNHLKMNTLITIAAAALLVSGWIIGHILWIAAGESDVNGGPETDSKQ